MFNDASARTRPSQTTAATPRPVPNGERDRRSLLRAASLVFGAVIACSASATMYQPTFAAPRPFAVDGEGQLAIADQTYFVGTDGRWHVELDLQSAELPAEAFTSPTTAPPPPTTALPPPTTGPSASTNSSISTPQTGLPTTVPTTTVPPPRPVLVTITVYPAIADIEAFDRLDPNGSTGPGGPIDSISVPFDKVATKTETGAHIVIDLGTGDGTTPSVRPLQVTETGVFPVRIAVGRDRTVFGSTNTFIERATESSATDRVVLTIVAGVPDIGPLPSNDQTADATRRIESIVALAASTSSPLTAIVPPSAVTAVGLKNRPLLSRLQRALDDDTVVAGPQYPLDPDVAEQDGLQENLQHSWATGTTATEEAFPNAAVDATTAVIDKPLSPAGLALLANAGIRAGITPFRVYSKATGNVGADTDATLLVDARTQVGTMPIAVVDPRMSLLDPSEHGNATAVERAARVLAYAGIRRRSAPHARTLVLTTPDIGVPDTDTIAAIDRLSDDTHIAWDSLPNALAATDTSVADGTDDGEPVTIAWGQQRSVDLAARAEKVKAAGLIIGDAISMLPAADMRRAIWPSELKMALSTAIDDDQADQIIAESANRSASIRGALPPPEPFTFTLTGSNTTLRFQLTNNSDTPLDAVVVMSSDRLVVPARTPVVLQPNAVNNVPIEITARSNGITKMSMYLETPAGNPLFAPVEMTGRVNTYRGVGQLVSVGALLVLATWWLTHLRRRPQPGIDKVGAASPDTNNTTKPQ